MSEAQIIPLQRIEALESLIKADSWLLIDLDNTLFESTQLYGHVDWFYGEIDRRIAGGMTKKEAIIDFHPQWEASQSTCSVKPVEEGFICLIQQLQKRQLPLMGLTHRQPILAESTLRQVRSLGIDLSLTAPSQENFNLSSDPIALYREGILFVGDFNFKGNIFKRYCEKIQKKPSHVIFVDDKLHHLEDLKKTLEPEGIDYLGIHYLAATRQKAAL